MREGIAIAHKDAKGVMAEAIEMGFGKRWGVTQELGEAIFNMYKRRTPEVLNEQTTQQIINQAWEDIKNISECMSPSEEDLKLYRNVRAGDFRINPCCGDRMELKSFSSCSLNPRDESYGKDKSFVCLNLVIPKGTPVLRIDKLHPLLRNEDDEVLLPPMVCEVTSTHEGDGKNCKKVIDLVPVKLLEIEFPSRENFVPETVL